MPLRLRIRGSRAKQTEEHLQVRMRQPNSECSIAASSSRGALDQIGRGCRIGKLFALRNQNACAASIGRLRGPKEPFNLLPWMRPGRDDQLLGAAQFACL